MPKNTQPDEEKGMVTPQKPKKINTEEISPAKTAPLTPQTITIDVNERPRSLGLMGMTRMKSVMVVGIMLGLAGGLAYFLLQWFEIPELELQIDRLKNEVTRLENQNNRYEELNEELNVTVGQLKVINGDLNNTANRLNETSQELGIKVAELEEQNQVFTDQNSLLSKTVDDLVLISAFLNETSQGLDDSLEQITDYLAELIKANQALVLGSLQNMYKIRKDGWDCDFSSVFGAEYFTQDRNAEISLPDQDRIMDYISNRVFDELCIFPNDFRVFLELPQYNPLTFNRLKSAMTIYTERALDFYFPDRDEIGLIHEDWADAVYDCHNLPEDKRYNFAT